MVEEFNTTTQHHLDASDELHKCQMNTCHRVEQKRNEMIQVSSWWKFCDVR